MGMLETLRSIVGGGASPVRLDAPALPGEAHTAMIALIADVKASIAPSLRDSCTDNYLEAVLELPQRDPTVALLTRVLGEPSKPFGKRAAFADDLSAMIESRGGIDTNQCLFLQRYTDGRVAFAALWPWSNGVTLTLKLGVYDAHVTPPA